MTTIVFRMIRRKNIVMMLKMVVRTIWKLWGCYWGALPKQTGRYGISPLTENLSIAWLWKPLCQKICRGIFFSLAPKGHFWSSQNITLCYSLKAKDLHQNGINSRCMYIYRSACMRWPLIKICSREFEFSSLLLIKLVKVAILTCIQDVQSYYETVLVPTSRAPSTFGTQRSLQVISISHFPQLKPKPIQTI